jgi:hypothetical protein
VPILYAEIQVANVGATFGVGSYSFEQIIDYQGRPSTDVRVGLIKLTFTGLEAVWPLWVKWMLDHYRRLSGRLVFYQGEGQTAKTLVFYDGACVHYECRFDARGHAGQSSLEVDIHITAAAVEVDGQHTAAHSMIPWPTDHVTSFRALTKPADPLSSPQLRAQGTPTAINWPPKLPTPPQLLPTECVVGSYRDLLKQAVVDDNITPHHIPSDAFMKRHGISRLDGICIHMEQPPIGGRHRQTKTYGRNMTSEERQAYYKLSASEALEADIEDARRIYREQDLLKEHVEAALQEVIRQNKATYPNLFK